MLGGCRLLSRCKYNILARLFEKHVQGKVHILSYRAIKQEIQKSILVTNLYGYLEWLNLMK